MSVTNKDVTIPASVSSDPVLALSVKFEINGTGITGEVRFTDIMYYDVEDGGCVDPTTEYFDIYHHDDVASAPSGARTSFDGGNIVLPIRYFRHFTTKWSTINVPFEVSKVVVYDEDDKVEYPLFPRFHNSTKDVEGYYWLKTFSGEVTLGNFKSAWQQLTVATDNDGMDGGSISDSEEEWLSQHVVPAKNTPYVIRFPYDDYYSTNWVIFYGNAFQTIPSSEDADCASSIALSEGYDYDQVKLQRNNMMKPTSSKTNIYTLNESDGVFYRETTTVPAFEAYVVGTRSVQRKFSRLSTTGENVADTPTSFEFVSKTGDYTGEVYTTTGQRLGTFNDPDALESYLEALPIGIYIVRTGAQINKVLVH